MACANDFSDNETETELHIVDDVIDITTTTDNTNPEIKIIMETFNSINKGFNLNEVIKINRMNSHVKVNNETYEFTYLDIIRPDKYIKDKFSGMTCKKSIKLLTILRSKFSRNIKFCRMNRYNKQVEKFKLKELEKKYGNNTINIEKEPAHIPVPALIPITPTSAPAPVPALIPITPTPTSAPVHVPVPSLIPITLTPTSAPAFVPRPPVPVPRPTAYAPRPPVPVPRPTAYAPRPPVPVPRPTAYAPRPPVPVPRPTAYAPRPPAPVPSLIAYESVHIPFTPMNIPNTPNIPIMVPTDFLKQFYLEYNTLVTRCTQMKDYINQLHDFLKNKLPDSKLPDSVQK